MFDKTIKYEDNINSLNNLINSITIGIYEINSYDENIFQKDNYKDTLLLINNFIENQNEKEGILLKIDNFHGFNINLENLKNWKKNKTNNQLTQIKGKILDYSISTKANYDNLLSIGICSNNKNNSDLLNKNCSKKLIVSTKQCNSVEDLNDKIKLILEYNKNSSINDKIYIKNCKDLLIDKNLEENIEIINKLENQLIAHEISDLLKINIEFETCSNINTNNNNKIGKPCNIYSIKSFRNDEQNNQFNVIDKQNHGIILKGDTIPAFTDPVNPIKIIKSNINATMSFNLFNRLNSFISDNDNDDDYNNNNTMIETLKKNLLKTCDNLCCDFPLKHVIDARNENNPIVNNSKIEETLKIKNWFCDF